MSQPPPPLTQADLNAAACNAPDCDHTAHDGQLWIHSHCHPGDPAWVNYDHGVITICCAVDSSVITRIAVAGNEQKGNPS